MPCTSAASATCGCRATSICSAAVRWAAPAGRTWRRAWGVVGILAVSSFPASPSLPKPAAAVQACAVPLPACAQQATMNHGLAVAVDGDDGTGGSFDGFPVVLQAIFQRLQLFAQVFAFLLQSVGLSSSSASRRHPRPRPAPASWFAARCVGLRACPAALLGARWKACRSAWVVPVASTHAQPSAFTSAARLASLSCAIRSSSVASVRYTPLSASANRSRRVPPPAASSIQPNEAHQRMPVGINLALGQAVAQVMRLRCHGAHRRTRLPARRGRR